MEEHARGGGERSCVSWFVSGGVGGLFGGLEFVAELLEKGRFT